MKILFGALAIAVLVIPNTMSAGTIQIGQIGDSEWYSDDTRGTSSSTGTAAPLVGLLGLR
jgi:hypothetical protein